MTKFSLPDVIEENGSGPRPVDGTYLFQITGDGPKPTTAGDKNTPQLEWPLKIAYAMPGYESQVDRTVRHYTWLHTKGVWKTTQVLTALGIKYKPGQTIDGAKFVGMFFGGKLQTEKTTQGNDRQEIKTVLSQDDFKIELAKARAVAKVTTDFDASLDDEDEEEEEVPRPKKTKVVDIVKKKRRPEPEPDEDEDDPTGNDLDDDDDADDADEDDEEEEAPAPPRRRALSIKDL